MSKGHKNYNIYTNSGASDPVNYSAPVAALISTTWTSSGLAVPGTWSFGVRAADDNGEEQNLDCAVTIVLDGCGNDITNRPAPPSGLRAFATAGGGIRVEWYYPPARGAKAPAGFNVYLGTGGVPNYTMPATTISYASGIQSTFVANLSGLTDGTTYTIGIRAFNASGEEANTASLGVTANATGPRPVDRLIATTVI